MDMNAAFASGSFSLPPPPLAVTWITRNVGISVPGRNASIAVLSPRNSIISDDIVAVIRRNGLLVKSAVKMTNADKDVYTFVVHDGRHGDPWEAIRLKQKCNSAALEIDSDLLNY